MIIWSSMFEDALEALNTKSKVYLYSWNWNDAADFYDPSKKFYYKG